MNSVQARLQVKPEEQPKFFRPRPVPFALKEAIELELDRLTKAGIIEKVDHSDWAAPVVPVPKGDGQLRLCGDRPHLCHTQACDALNHTITGQWVGYNRDRAGFRNGNGSLPWS